MSLTAAKILTTLSKPAITWVGGILSKWIDRKLEKSQAERKAWGQITTRVINQTRTMAARYMKVTTVAFPKLAVPLLKIYVPLTIEESDRKSFRVETFPNELFGGEGKILLVDSAGMGKSTIAKIIYIHSLEEEEFLPLLIDLRRLTDESIEKALRIQFGITAKNEEIFSEFLHEQPLLYIFDGFDEVMDDFKVKVARNIRDFVDHAPLAKFLLTSRQETIFSSFTDFSLCHIRELEKREAFSLIQKYGDAFDAKDPAKELLNELDANHSEAVESFLKNPLLTSLLFRAFEYRSVIPVKRGVFYRQVFDSLFDTHDLNKETGYVRGKKTGLHHDDFHRSLRGMASLFRQKRVVEVKEEDFLQMARQVSSNLCPDLIFTPSDFLHDALHAVPVFVRDGAYVRWSHKSLLDYFLAEFLLRDFSGSKEGALEKVAFSLESFASENFLTLVQEADPSLFAKAVTVPAIKEVLQRYERIRKLVPSSINSDAANEVANLFMGYEACCLSESSDVNWTDDGFVAYEGIERNEYFPRVSFLLGARGQIVFLIHKSMAALRVPMKMGALAHVARFIHQRPVRMGRQDQHRVPNNPVPLLHGYSKNGFEGADEEVKDVLDLTGTQALDIPLVKSLRVALQTLEDTVNRSVGARGGDIF